METTDRWTMIRRFADELLTATDTRVPIPPLRDQFDGMSLQDAYDIQDLQLQQQVARGRRLAGRKVGLTSLAMQHQLGVDAPDFGYFFEDMIYYDGAEISMSHFISPKVEPEFGFVLKHDLIGPGVSVDKALEAIGGIYPAMEIIDSRIANWDIKLVDTVADNASCGAIAVGHTPLVVDRDALIDVSCSLKIGSDIVSSGTGADVMGHPAAPLAWLANALGRHGVALKAGQLILPGSFTKAEVISDGATATADFGGLGSLTVHFVA